MKIDTDHLRWWEFDHWEADRCHEVTTLSREFRSEMKRFRGHWKAVDGRET